MRFLSSVLGVSRRDRLRNDDIRNALGMAGSNSTDRVGQTMQRGFISIEYQRIRCFIFLGETTTPEDRGGKGGLISKVGTNCKVQGLKKTTDNREELASINLNKRRNKNLI